MLRHLLTLLPPYPSILRLSQGKVNGSKVLGRRVLEVHLNL
jgi:hypothetical protein